jgi:hypothetical protein
MLGDHRLDERRETPQEVRAISLVVLVISSAVFVLSTSWAVYAAWMYAQGSAPSKITARNFTLPGSSSPDHIHAIKMHDNQFLCLCILDLNAPGMKFTPEKSLKAFLENVFQSIVASEFVL